MLPAEKLRSSGYTKNSKEGGKVGKSSRVTGQQRNKWNIERNNIIHSVYNNTKEKLEKGTKPHFPLEMPGSYSKKCQSKGTAA